MSMCRECRSRARVPFFLVMFLLMLVGRLVVAFIARTTRCGKQIVVAQLAPSRFARAESKSLGSALRLHLFCVVDREQRAR